MLIRRIFCLIALSIAFQGWGEIPTHLKDLRILEENVLPKNTSYDHHPSIVKWKGEGGATQYISHTDCSGLIDALLQYSYGYSPSSLETWLHKSRPKARNYYDAIVEQRGFQHITNINQVLSGDFLAIKFPKGLRNTGHIAVVDDTPKLIDSMPPLVTGLKQWKVKIIDSTAHGHGKQDSRYLGNRKFRLGLGQGSFRLYTDKSDNIVGYSWSLSSYSSFYGFDSRPIAIGRLIPGYQP